MLSIALLVLFGAIQKDRLPGMELADRARALGQRLTFDNQGVPSGFVEDAGHPLWIYDSLRKETAYRVVDERGDTILASPGAVRWPDSADISHQKQGRFSYTIDDALVRGATEPIEHDGKTWFVQLTTSNRIIDFLHRGFALPFIQLGIEVFSLILLFVFGIGAFITLKYSLKPLRQASESAAAISPRSLQGRLSIDRMPSEVLPLVNSFNQALERLEKGYRIQQEFLGTAAHELKTPLTLIRSEIELMQAEPDTRDSLLKYTGHMARQIQQLLLLAEASERLSYDYTDVDVLEASRECAHYLERLADAGGLRLTVCGMAGGVIWRADRGAFFTLLKNLLENAIQHAPPGTEVRTEVRRDSISVRDWGPGVDQKHLALLFVRFWRGPHRRDYGAGLGLAICQEISQAHGWTLSAHDAAPGLVFRIARNE
ncbi:ATP-binding protein [Achromobacter sp.]|uniref:ATP-binding protein n=1 Tax=Achromobacter sp. TaxID=134375 RepID=UPI0028B1F44F|nr:ATP-binding protein [Achromobacter sp.]